MYTPLLTPQEMNHWDHVAIHDFGIRNEMLMENASREALHVLQEEVGEVKSKHILLFMGSGNNGGDAACLARHLHDLGANVLVLHTRPKNSYKGVTGYHIRLARAVGVSFTHLSTTAKLPQSLPWQHPDIVIDGLLGTGFSGELREDYQRLVETINALRQHAFIFSLDIPSGINGKTGVPSPTAVMAHATVSFEALKVGLIAPQARAYTGKLFSRKIGIPAAVHQQHPPLTYLLDNTIAALHPTLSPDMHKGSSGHVLVVGGSSGLTGAPNLAALGALRAGAGYVTIACPAALATEVKAGVPDILTLPLGTGAEWSPAAFTQIEALLPHVDALVIGPGMGRSNSAGAFLEWLLAMKQCPAIFDADALFHLAERPSLLNLWKKHDILTPHPGEMARLIKIQTSAVQANRLEIVQKFVAEHAGVLVLKGACTCIGEATSPLYISPFATPNLAVAGSGDVLAGVMGSLIAQGLSAHEAASLAVYEHGMAGELLAHQYPARGNTAQEIAHAIPQAIKELLC